MTKPSIYLAAKLTAIVAVTILLAQTNAEFVEILISALVFSCFILTDLVFARTQHGKTLCLASLTIIILGCIYYGANIYFPLFILAIAEACDYFAEGKFLVIIDGVCLILSAIVFLPSAQYLILAAVIWLGTLFTLHLLAKIEKLDAAVLDEKVENAELAKNNAALKTYVKTIKETTAMEERNRFAARIHDQLGHSISGSIIMLEAAQLCVDSNPVKTKEIIHTATENLREGVDEIRKSLREERPNKGSLGLGEIKAKLEGFGVTYHMETAMEVKGDTNLIPLPVWLCINENLGEAMTNTLKHSKATAFQVKIHVLNQLIRVEYSDNGVCDGIIKKGMGLEAIEDRTAVCGGRCIFYSGQNGFMVTNLFLIEPKR